MRRERSFGWPDVGVLSSSALWGLNFTTVKIALRDLPPPALGFLRFAAATVLLFVLLVIAERGVRVARRDLPRLALMGALSIGVNQALFLAGMQRTSASIGAIMFACASAFTIMLAVLLLRERAGWQLWPGMLLATAGIALIVGVGGTGGGGAGDKVADLEVFLSSLAVGLSSLVAKGVLRRYSALRVTAWTALCGVACLAPLSAGSLAGLRWASVRAGSWEALAFSSVGASVATIVLWNYGLARVGVTRATVYSYLQPFLGVIFAALLLGDRLGLRELAGGAIALLGTWLASSATFAHAPVAAPPEDAAVQKVPAR
jgi:drug/metabolite transporter (DMT)-like permease